MGARLFLTLMAAFALLLGHAPQATAAPVVHAAHAGSKTVGLSTYVWGSVTESGAQEVWTEVQLPSGWSRSQASRTDAGGGYTIELTYGFTTPGQYRFRVGSRTHAGVVYSPVFTLTRTAWQPGWAVTKPILQTTNTWGTVPLAAGRSVWTEAMVDGRWSRSQTRIANATGYFVVPLTYGASQARPQTFRVGASTPRGTVYSQAFVLTRTGSVEAHTAGTKQVGQVTNTWGTVRGHGGGQVWTQVIVNGSWSTSQVRTASASGYFVIPLTYGATTPGSYTYRVGAATPSGTVYSSPFTLRRTAPTTSDLVERWRGQDIESFPTTRPVVALTFDGGADNSAVARILATLEANDVPATFFVTGGFARAYPDDVRAMSQAGHPVGNHSNTHPEFTRLSAAGIRDELRLAENSISPLTGSTTAPLFRFPFGDRSASVIQTVNNAGYIPIRWNIDSLGWQGTSGGITAAVVRQRVLAGLKPGAVVLMHVGAHPQDRSTPDADALQGIIHDLRARGYGFTTVDQLLREN